MNMLAHQYQSIIDLSRENNSHTQLIRLTGPNKKVLEIGPATGHITQILKQRGCSVTCVELNPEMAKANRYCDRMINGNAETIDFQKEFDDEKFDVLLLGDVLEHLTDPAMVLDKIYHLLDQNGYLVASIPNVAHGSVRFSLLRGEFTYDDKGILDRSHLRFFTYKTVVEMFDRSDFVLTKIIRVTADPFRDQNTKYSHPPPRFPKAIIKFVLSDKESFTYQFVLQAYRKDPSKPFAAPLQETLGYVPTVPFLYTWGKRIRRYKNSLVKRLPGFLKK